MKFLVSQRHFYSMRVAVLVKRLCNRIIDDFMQRDELSESGISITLRGIERILFIVMALEISSIRIMDEGEFHSCSSREYIDALKLYFQGISNPIISMDEIRYFLFKALHMSSDDADIICDVIKRELPELRPCYQPRSLLHICRLKLRAVRPVFPRVSMAEWVNNLPIPSFLKTLLLIGDSVCFLH